MRALLVGCASVTAYRAPNSSLENLGSIYIVHFSPDKRNLESVIADDLRSRGYNVSYGEKDAMPTDIDTIVNYIDHWKWDMSIYMLDIEIEFREAKDNKKIASAKSYRPSIQRASPKKMIQETIDKILE